MTEDSKTKILHQALENISSAVAHMDKDLAQVSDDLLKTREELKHYVNEQMLEMFMAQAELQTRKKNELQLLSQSPYFARCDVRFSDSDQIQSIYFGKFSFPEKSIFSWVSPAAVIRFKTPGDFSYTLPSGKSRDGKLTRKDQFMITDQKLHFLASESIDYKRELIYQEFFSNRKTGFMLPEIVEQMEQAQDQVIRADFRGPLLISGPAGSGKTTLALHRVAYLLQSPDTARIFNLDNIIIFVQDTRTRKYFSELLPQLGIHNVTITTFMNWAMKILALDDYTQMDRYGNSEDEKDHYEYAKNLALNAKISFDKKSTSIFQILKNIYKPFLDQKQQTILKEQYEKGLLDKFDLTILLLHALEKEGGRLYDNKIIITSDKRGRVKRVSEKKNLRYSLMVIDETENYLPRQLEILHSCTNQDLKSTVYVGDLGQQTSLFTIKDWQTTDSNLTEERMVKLTKVFRSTKQIIEYIVSLGYDMDIHNELRNGPEVFEKLCTSKAEEIEYIKNITEKNPDNTIGILSKNSGYLDDFKNAFVHLPHIHVLTINEAQGVEFDITVLVGINEGNFLPKPHDDIAFFHERKRVSRDLIFVALTRAMQELHLLGMSNLRAVLNKLI